MGDEREMLAHALRECRRIARWSQEEMAKELGLSRKTYMLFETERWLPAPKQRAFFVKALHALHPPSARALAAVFGEKVEDHALVLPLPQAASPPLDAKQAKLAFDAVLYASAEELEMAPKVMRAVAMQLFARVVDAGLTLAQAASLAKGAGKT